MTRLIPEEGELGPGLRLRIRDETRFWRENLGGPDPLVRSARLPCGKYELVVLGGDFAALDIPFEIKSGEETHLDVPIRRGHTFCLAPGAYRVEVRAGDRQAEGELIVGTADGEPPRLQITLQ